MVARCGELFLVIVIAVGAASPSSVASSDLHQGDPQPRLEVGTHAAAIRRLDVDQRERFIVTVSDDKTLRVWELPSLQLVRTIWVPQARGNEGQLFALALSPDGTRAATGGFTGIDLDGHGRVYIISLVTGDFLGEIGDLPSSVGALEFSPDGNYLAVGLHGGFGVQVRKTSDWSVHSWDTEYNDGCMGLSFSPAGRLAAVALDGFARLYDDDHVLLRRRKLTVGSIPSVLRYSPDAERIAIGFQDAAAVEVVSAHDLSTLWRPPPPSGIASSAQLFSVSWSSDGSFLYASGNTGRGPDAGRVFRWPLESESTPTIHSAGSVRISEMRSLSRDSLIFATERPAIGILGGKGKRTRYVPAPIPPLSEALDRVSYNRTGTAVSFPANFEGNEVCFDLQKREVGDECVLAGTPSRSVEGVSVEHWRNSRQPVLNGIPLELDPHEQSRAVAVDRRSRNVLVGAEWSLRLFSSDGKGIWSQYLHAPAWEVGVPAVGGLAIAALGDGTIRWYGLSDGTEVAALFVDPISLEWIIWTPEGYYLSSPKGDELFGWVVNRSRYHVADFFRAVQFERTLYRPDVVSTSLLKGENERSSGKVLIHSILPPRVVFESATVVRPRLSGPTARIRFRANALGSPMKAVTVFVNGIPITEARERPVSAGEEEFLRRELEIPLPAGEPTVRIEADAGTSMGVGALSIVNTGVANEIGRGSLVVVSVGVNLLEKMPESSLLYAAQDARGLARFLGTAGRAVYEDVSIVELSDLSEAKPTRAGVRDALRRLAETTANDTVILFIASHGITNSRGDYFILPREADPGDVDAVLAGARSAKTLLRWDVFFEALRSASGRRILIVDTCHARQITGALDVGTLKKRSASSSFALLAASKEEEEAQEFDEAQQGLYTAGLLEALSGDGDKNGDGWLALKEVHDHAARFVAENRNKLDGPQSPSIVAPEVLRRSKLVPALETP